MPPPQITQQTPIAKRVTLVVDLAAGVKAKAAAETDDVWLIESPINQASAEAHWADSHPTAGSLTTFKAYGSTPDEWAAEVLEAIEEHHGQFAQDQPFTELLILGSGASERLNSALRAIGFVVADSKDQRLLAVREA